MVWQFWGRAAKGVLSVSLKALFSYPNTFYLATAAREEFANWRLAVTRRTTSEAVPRSGQMRSA